jgi:hypothetical protein
MNRREFLAGVGGATIGILSGCTESGLNSRTPGDSTDSNDGTPENPVAAGDPWLGTILHLSSGSGSPEAIRTAFSADIPRILLGASMTTAFVETEDTDAVENAAQEAGLDIHGSMSVAWDGGAVCDVRNWIQFPDNPTEATVREAFPNAIDIFRYTSSGAEMWKIYTPQVSRDELSSRLGDLGVGSETSLVTYSSCNTDSSTPTAEP